MYDARKEVKDDVDKYFRIYKQYSRNVRLSELLCQSDDYDPRLVAEVQAGHHYKMRERSGRAADALL